MSSEAPPVGVGGETSAWVHFLRFVAVGVLNTIVYWAAFVGLDLIAPYMVAHFAAFFLAMVCSYLVNTWWTFRVRPSWRTFAAFPLTNVPNLLATTVGVVVLVEWVGTPAWLAPLVAAGLAVPVTFVLVRFLLLRGRRPAATGSAGGPGTHP